MHGEAVAAHVRSTGTGPAAGDLLRAIQSSYDRAAAAWDEGPGPLIYRPLADALIAHSPVPLQNRAVLDVGAGTGVVSAALERAGARPIAIDFAPRMLAQRRQERPPSAAGDATRLPVRAAAVDGLASGFCFNHLPDPSSGFHEAQRVVRPGGVVLVSTFAAQPPHPAKAIVDAIVTEHGYVPPAWHLAVKQKIEPLTASADRLAAFAERAGLVEIEAVERAIDVGLDTAESLAAWRLGMANLASFLESLSDEQRRSLWNDAIAALGPDPEPNRPVVVLCSARVSR